MTSDKTNEMTNDKDNANQTLARKASMMTFKIDLSNELLLKESDKLGRRIIPRIIYVSTSKLTSVLFFSQFFMMTHPLIECFHYDVKDERLLVKKDY